MSKLLFEKTGRIGRIDGVEAERLGLVLKAVPPEGLNFKQRAETVGWKQAVDERDRGSYDWSDDRPIDPPG